MVLPTIGRPLVVSAENRIGRVVPVVSRPEVEMVNEASGTPSPLTSGTLVRVTPGKGTPLMTIEAGSSWVKGARAGWVGVAGVLATKIVMDVVVLGLKA